MTLNGGRWPQHRDPQAQTTRRRYGEGLGASEGTNNARTRSRHARRGAGASDDLTVVGTIRLTAARPITHRRCDAAARIGYTATSLALGNSALNSTSVTTVANANTTIGRVDAALTSVSGLRSTFGAIQNRFESTIANLQAVSENLDSVPQPHSRRGLRGRDGEPDARADPAAGRCRDSGAGQCGAAERARAAAVRSSHAVRGRVSDRDRARCGPDGRQGSGPDTDVRTAADAVPRWNQTPRWLHDERQPGERSARHASRCREAGRPKSGGEVRKRQGLAADRQARASARPHGRGRPKIDISRAIHNINAFLQENQRGLRFQVDKDTGRTVITVINPVSGEIVRQIPPQEVLNIARELKVIRRYW